MNHIGFLPNDIVLYIYQLLHISYFKAFNSFLIHKYDCDLDMLSKSYIEPSVTYIFARKVDKCVDILYHDILFFNLRNKYYFSIKKSVNIINKHLKNNI